MRGASLRTFLYVVACLALTSHSFGQDTTPFATVRVIVRDSQANLLNGARVTGLGPEERTDSSGTVTYSGVGFGRKTIIVYYPGAKAGIAVPEIKSSGHVDVEIKLAPQIDCPSGDDLVPPTTPLQPRDYVELDYPDGMVRGFRVRIRADGEVSWRGASAGGGLVFFAADAVSPRDAAAIIERFRSQEFWSMCGHYDPGLAPTDQSLEIATVQIGRHLRRVSDYARSAPEEFRTLTRAFHELAQVEKWWRPGPAPLQYPYWIMGVSALARDQAMELFRKQDLKWSDTTGHTLLMYATHEHWSPDLIRSFIRAGANPATRSRDRQTSLMIAVTGSWGAGPWIDELIAAGVDVNAQDRDGRTVLMLAVQRFSYYANTDIAAMLRKAGAKTDIRDAYGMTALDYLEQDAKRSLQPAGYQLLREVLTKR